MGPLFKMSAKLHVHGSVTLKMFLKFSAATKYLKQMQNFSNLTEVSRATDP